MFDLNDLTIATGIPAACRMRNIDRFPVYHLQPVYRIQQHLSDQNQESEESQRDFCRLRCSWSKFDQQKKKELKVLSALGSGVSGSKSQTGIVPDYSLFCLKSLNLCRRRTKQTESRLEQYIQEHKDNVLFVPMFNSGWAKIAKCCQLACKTTI